MGEKCVKTSVIFVDIILNGPMPVYILPEKSVRWELVARVGKIT